MHAPAHCSLSSQVLAVDASVSPPSVGIEVAGAYRETEQHRLCRRLPGAQPPPPPPAAPADEDFGDFEAAAEVATPEKHSRPEHHPSADLSPVERFRSFLGAALPNLAASGAVTTGDSTQEQEQAEAEDEFEWGAAPEPPAAAAQPAAMNGTSHASPPQPEPSLAIDRWERGPPPLRAA